MNKFPGFPKEPITVVNGIEYKGNPEDVIRDLIKQIEDLKEHHQSYYCVIPWKLLTDKSIPSAAKLLYGEISALTNKEGFCWATNQHFGETLGLEPRTTVSRLINALKNANYIYIEIEENYKRKIWLQPPHIKNEVGVRQKRGQGYIKNEDIDNINIDNNKEINISTQSLKEKAIEDIYNHYCFRFSKNCNSFKLSPKRVNKIKARLEEFDVKQILTAIDHAADDDFYSGNNDKGWTADLDYITRSYEVMERLVNLIPRKGGQSGRFKHPNAPEKGKYDDIVER